MSRAGGHNSECEPDTLVLDNQIFTPDTDSVLAMAKISVQTSLPDWMSYLSGIP